MTCLREVKALVMAEIEALGREYQLKYYEQVKVSTLGREYQLKYYEQVR
jgi:hypothetical protein